MGLCRRPADSKVVYATVGPIACRPPAAAAGAAAQGRSIGARRLAGHLTARCARGRGGQARPLTRAGRHDPRGCGVHHGLGLGWDDPRRAGGRARRRAGEATGGTVVDRPGKTLPLPCASAAFAADTAPLCAVRRPWTRRTPPAAGLPGHSSRAATPVGCTATAAASQRSVPVAPARRLRSASTERQRRRRSR